MITSLNRLTLCTAALLLLGCGGGSEDASTATSPDSQTQSSPPASTDVLAGPVPPDACAALTEARAAEILGAAPTRRPGPACAYVSGAGDAQRMVRMLFTSYPLETLDASAMSDQELAQMIGGLAQLGAEPASEGEVAGGPAFSAEVGRASALFVLPGIRMSAAISDRPVGEVVINVSVQDSRPHRERLETAEALAQIGADYLRREASNADR